MSSISNRRIIVVFCLMTAQIVGVLILASVLRLSVNTTTFILWMLAMVWLAMVMTYLGLRAPSRPIPTQYPHAAKAAKDARRGRESLLDIGFVAFWGKNTMYTYRTQPIPTSADTLQPYIQIHNRRRRFCRVEFDILDSSDKPVFHHEVASTLSRGVHFLMPPARLRLNQQTPNGNWKLRVCVNEVILALHEFTWLTDEIMSVDGHINADGEVDEQIAALLVDNYAAPLSLDDLMTKDDDKKLGNTQR